MHFEEKFSSMWLLIVFIAYFLFKQIYKVGCKSQAQQVDHDLGDSAKPVGDGPEYRLSSRVERTYVEHIGLADGVVDQDLCKYIDQFRNDDRYTKERQRAPEWHTLPLFQYL